MSSWAPVICKNVGFALMALWDAYIAPLFSLAGLRGKGGDGSGVNPAGDRGDTSPQMSDGEGTVMHHVPPNTAEISLHKRQRIRLYLLNYAIVLFLSNISCLQLCQMFYRGQLCELYFQILDHKQSRRPPPPNFPSDLRHWGMVNGRKKQRKGK